MILAHKVTLYIPGTNAVKTLDPDAQSRWKDEALAILARAFGGATADGASTGAWQSPTAGLVVEPIIKVHAFADAATMAHSTPLVMDFARRMGREMGQEAVSVEIDNALHILPTAA